MRENENEISIVEFAEKIIGSDLPTWQKEFLIKWDKLGRPPLHVNLSKCDGYHQARQAYQKLCKILYGPDI